MMSRNCRGWQQLTSMVFVLVSVPSYALQLIDARDGMRVEALVATKEPTRIRIQHAPITDVFGNIASSNCNGQAAMAGVAASVTPSPATPINPSGEVALECDRDKGEIYVRPVGRSNKPINLFISSAQATYTLLLRRADIPAETIVIRDTSARSNRTDRPGTRFPSPAISANPFRAMKALLIEMASERPDPDTRVAEINRTIPLWAEGRFALLRTYESRGWIGEKYLLTNISTQPMVLAEQEFDRPDHDIVAIAIENMNLRPGDATSVYVIRMGK